MEGTALHKPRVLERVRKSGREPRRSPGQILDGSGDGIPDAHKLSCRRHRLQAQGRHTRGHQGAIPFALATAAKRSPRAPGRHDGEVPE